MHVADRGLSTSRRRTCIGVGVPGVYKQKRGLSGTHGCRRRRRRRRRLYSSVPHLGQHRPATVQMCPRHHACAAPRVSTTTSRTLNERAPTRAPGDHPAPLSPGIRLVSVTLHARPRDAAAPHRHARGLWPRAARAAPCEMARERDRRRIGRGDAPGSGLLLDGRLSDPRV